MCGQGGAGWRWPPAGSCLAPAGLSLPCFSSLSHPESRRVYLSLPKSLGMRNTFPGSYAPVCLLSGPCEGVSPPLLTAQGLDRQDSCACSRVL